MSSSIFNFEPLARAWRLPLNEKLRIALLAAVFAGIVHAGATLLPADRAEPNHRTAAVAALDDQTRVLVLGSSHVRSGVNPAWLSMPAMNLAVSSANYQVLDLVLDANLDRAPHVELALIELDIWLLLSDTLREYGRDLSLLYDMGVPSDRLAASAPQRAALAWRRLFHDGYAAPLVSRRKWTPAGLLAERNAAPVTPGFASSVRRIVPSGDGHRTLAYFQRKTEVSLDVQLRRNLAALERVIDTLHAHGCRVVLVRTPHHDSYWAHRDPAYDQAEAVALAALRERLGGRMPAVWDFSRLPGLDAGHFKDANHLNHAGAATFTAVLDAKITAMLDVTDSALVRAD